MASKKRDRGQRPQAETQAPATGGRPDIDEGEPQDEEPGGPTTEEVERARAEGAPWLEELGKPDIDETDELEHTSQVDRLSEIGDEHERADQGELVAALEPVPAAPSHELTHDPDPRLRESAEIAAARLEAQAQPARAEGEVHHMGGPLYWFETRGERGEGFTRGMHTVELPTGPWRGFQAIPLESEDNLVLAGHVVSHHRGQSAQVHVQGASGWAPVIALVLVRDERAHVQAEAVGA